MYKSMTKSGILITHLIDSQIIRLDTATIRLLCLFYASFDQATFYCLDGSVKCFVLAPNLP